MMLCILPPTRLALGQVAKASVGDASGLFNMMRNLGGAIGIAVIDTVIYTQAPIYARKLSERVAAGDLDVLKTLGAPPGMDPAALLDPRSQAILKPLIDRTAYTDAINDAWALLAVITLLAIAFVPLTRAPIWRLMVSIRQGQVFVQHRRT